MGGGVSFLTSGRHTPREACDHLLWNWEQGQKGRDASDTGTLAWAAQDG